MVKILVNGCSHSEAHIPDIEDPLSGIPWPTILGDLLKANVFNMSRSGKANNVIVEETIRYLINEQDINHVVIQLTEFSRLNFFREKYSFAWIPGDVSSQLNIRPNNFYVKPETDDIFVRRVTDNISYHASIGDKSLIYDIITLGTLVNCLSVMCKQRNIGLTIISYYLIGDSIEDEVWNSIPEESFLVKNRRYGIQDHFTREFQLPDGGHFEQKFHYHLAKLVSNHINNKTQIIVNTESYNRNKIIYNYTN
tara:strand:- start:38 stop:793 length:756 start_codon:yes stop_codon:yes gene_type:complete